MVKRSDLFVASGEGNYWFPRILPADPNLVKIHDNVHVTGDVYFNTHSVMQRMFGVVPDYYQMLPESVRKSKGYPYYSGEIEAFGNCFIGAKTIVMYGVKICPTPSLARVSSLRKKAMRARRRRKSCEGDIHGREGYQEESCPGRPLTPQILLFLAEESQ